MSNHKFRSNSKSMSFKKRVMKNSKAISKLNSSIEKKVSLVERVLLPAVVGAQTLLLNGMSFGTEWGDRIGQKIKNNFLELNYGLINNAGVPSIIRVMIVYDKQPQGQLFDEDRLWAVPTTDFERITSVKNQTFGTDYSVLFDKLIVISGTTNNNSNRQRHFKIRLALNRVTQFNDVALANFTAMEKNALYFIIVSESVNVSWYLMSNLHYIDA